MEVGAKPLDVVVEQCADTLRAGRTRRSDPRDATRRIRLTISGSWYAPCRATPAAPARARCPPVLADWRQLIAATLAGDLPSWPTRARGSAPVAASTTSTMYAPPTRADVSRNSQEPSRAWMNSVCEAPRPSPNVASTCSFSARSGADAGSRRRSVEVTKMPPSCATAMRRHPVPAGHREPHAAVEDDRVDVIDVAGHELLEHVVRLRVAEPFECSPEIVARCELADADRRGLRPRLEDPGRRDPARSNPRSPDG